MLNKIKNINIDTYHVLPIDDIKEHTESEFCHCHPKVEGNVIIHNSFDLREYSEGTRQ